MCSSFSLSVLYVTNKSICRDQGFPSGFVKGVKGSLIMIQEFVVLKRIKTTAKILIILAF